MVSISYGGSINLLIKRTLLNIDFENLIEMSIYNMTI